MRNALAALTDELRRLQTAGVKRVPVSDESLAALRRAIGRRKSAAGTAAPAPLAVPRVENPKEVGRIIPNPPGTSTNADGANGGLRITRPTFPPPPTFELPAGDKAARWAALRERVRDDPICRLHLRAGKQVVVGVGDLDARIFFVGEAPGAEEEMQGEPFVGPAGQLLDRMIAGMGLKRGDVYIGNIMNWRPEMPIVPGGVQSGNRPPKPEEMAYCLPYLLAQVEIVAPAILVALGATAAQALLGAGTFRALGEVRGRWHEFAGKPLMVTYHPSYILRNPTNRSKRLIWEDLLQVMARAELAISDKQRAYFLEK